MVNLRKNILMVLIAVLIIIAIIVPTTVRATDDQVDVIVPGGSSSASPKTTTSPKTTQTPKATPASNSSKLPQTGTEDYKGIIIAVVVLGGSSVFAYKKIKEYNKF